MSSPSSGMSTPVWNAAEAANTGIPEPRLTRHQFGMLAFLASEAAFFGTLLVVYLKYLGQDPPGSPTPSSSLHLSTALVNTVLLVTSSVTIAWAHRALAGRRIGPGAAWLALTILLGIGFLVVTGMEWGDLIFNKGLTIRRNLFGTTYFTLIGFHGAHVTVGIVAMLVFLALCFTGGGRIVIAAGLELLSWYWHFVDGVWIAILLIVYIL